LKTFFCTVSALDVASEKFSAMLNQLGGRFCALAASASSGWNVLGGAPALLKESDMSRIRSMCDDRILATTFGG